MKRRPLITLFSMLCVLAAAAQNVTEEPDADPVLDAIKKFNGSDKESSNEVSVVLDTVGVPPAPLVESPAPLFVSGTHPDVPAPEAAMTTNSGADPEPENGLAVRVEKIHGTTGVTDPSQVKLLAPFPAKPLAPTPAGWILDASDSAPPFTREVEIAPGSKITLAIRPHLLVPDADGAAVFTISEPGFDSSLGYRQAATVGAILSTSIRQLDEDSKQLGTAIDSLQQLLLSLPKPEPKPEAKPAAIRKR